jgi:polynucleotide 5'-hydroxyl-kinase GRC3/NOL9
MLKVRMVKGPATVIVHGSCHVLGSDVSNQTISVRAGKALPFELSGRCKLYAKLGNGGRLWTPDPFTAGTALWRNIARKIFVLTNDRKTFTVILMGDVDTGKSTLSTYLVNMALAYEVKPCIIDADIGQGDLAPPAAIGAAAPSKQIIDLRDVCASLFEFVGSISPAGIEHFMTMKLKSIVERSNQLGNFIIINTDGYVRDDGIAYKVHMAEMLNPDLIVCLGESLALFDILKSRSWRVLRAPASSQTYKSRIERIGRRFDQFSRYIGDGKKNVDIEQVKFEYNDNIISPLEELQSSTIKRSEELANMEGMFVGLGFRNEVTGFGIIESITDDSMYIQTNVQDFDRVYLSKIRLSKDVTSEIKLKKIQDREDQVR